LNVAAAVFLATLLGCGPESQDPTQDPTKDPTQTGDEIRSDKKRVQSPSVPDTDLKAQVDGNNTFAFDLYQKVMSEPGNLFYSPHSISMALAMLHAGARGNTERQMEQALSFVLPQSRLHPALNKLDLELESRGKGKKAADGKAFRLKVVNALWGQRGYSFLPGYLDVLALNYGAGLRLLNFVDQPETSRLAINDWVEQQTEQRIKDLLPPGSITPLTRMVLTNAIYFNAAWAESFEKEATQETSFNRLDGSTVQVKMMRDTKRAGYVEGQGVKAVALPYDGDELSMVVIVPDAGTFASFEQALDRATVDKIIRSLSWDQMVKVGLPRFEFTKPLNLVPPLQAIGMTDAFQPGEADLSGIDGTRKLVVTGVLHKAFVKVNEAGTEAAAATAIIAGGAAAPTKTAELIADRPFIFLIRDHRTGAILFVGRVLDPTA
jgi:serpin B